jgi:tetratricopeptide (TPR) repeat protein
MEARSLRFAFRMSVRSFADHLGVGARTVSKWEKCLGDVKLRPGTQAVLDTALAGADEATHVRFETHLAEANGSRPPTKNDRSNDDGPSWDYEAWADDLDRAIIALSRQDFAFGTNLVQRWTTPFRLRERDDKGVYLFARSLATLGDIRRDQGKLDGPSSPHSAYTSARSLFHALGIPRRAAQQELSLAVVTEMRDRYEVAARHYTALASDDRLTGRDRARALLWVGTTLSKGGEHGHAIRAMNAAVRRFEDLSEPEDWAVAHQKLALAHRGVGDLDAALSLIDIARRSGTVDAPMHHVRLDTAHGHILLSDPATEDEGVQALDRAASLAMRFNLRHQLDSISNIRSAGGKPLRRTRTEGDDG